MAVVRTLLRFFSYLFHGLLALFLLAISGLTLLSGESLHLGMLPWTGSTLTLVLLIGSLVGLAALLLAMWGRLRALFFLWCLAVLVLMVKGYVFSGYHFGSGEARLAGYLMLAALLALAGGWFQMWRPIDRRPRY